MAGEQSVGRVTVEVVPDASNFGKEAESELKRQRIDPKNVNIVPRIDANMAELQTQITAIAKSLDRNATIQVQADFSGVSGIDGLINQILPPDGLKLHASWDATSEEGLRRTLEQIEQTFATRHELVVTADTAEDAANALRDTIAQIEREKVRISTELVLNEERLRQSAKDMHLRLEADFDFSGTRAQFEEEMRRLEVADWKAEIDAQVIPSFVESKAAEVRGRLASFFRDISVGLLVSMDDSHVRVVQGILGFLSRARDIALIPEVQSAARAVASASLALLTRTRTVQISVGRGLLNVGSVLSGLDALQENLNRAREGFLGLFTNLPNVAGITTGFFGLAGAVLSAASNFASLAGSAAQALPVLLALPGIAIGITVLSIAFGNLKKTMPEVSAMLTEFKASIQSDFWSAPVAGIGTVKEAFAGFLSNLVGSFGGLATVMGTFMGTLFGAIQNLPLAAWFDNLSTSVVTFQGYMGPIAAMLNQIGSVGSAMLIPLAALVGQLAGQFASWLGRLVTDAGGVTAFADQSVGALRGIIDTVIQLGAIFGAVFRAAQDSGSATFTSLAASMQTWAEGGGLDRLQERLTTLFNAAHTMWDNFGAAAGDGMSSAMENVTKLLSAVLPVVGTIMGTLTKLLSSAITPESMAGIKAFVDGVAKGVEAMAPAFATLGPLIGQLGPVLGTLATIIGQVFGALAPSIGNVVAALSPLIQLLGGGLVRVIQAVQPAIEKLATALSEALASPALTAAIDAVISALIALAPALMPLVDLAARLVTALLPVVAAVLQPIAGLITQLVPLLDPIVAVVMGIVSAVMPLVPMLVNLVNAVIQPLLPLLVTLANAVLPLLVPIIQVMAILLQTVMLVLQPIIDIALPLLTGLLTVLTGVIALVVEAIAGFVQGGLQWMQDGIAKVSDSIAAFGEKWRAIWQNVFDFFRSIWSNLLNWIKDLLGIHSPSQWFLDLATNMLQGMLDGLNAAWGWITGFISAGFIWIVNFVIDALETAQAVVRGAWRMIGEFFSDGIDRVKSLVSEGLSRVQSFITDGINRGVTTIGALPGRVVGVLSGIGTTLYQSGRDLVQGLLNGIGSLAGSIGNWFLDKIPGWIREPFKAALGIHSPSTVFFDFGENIIQGLVRGMESQHSKVFRSMGTLADGVAGTEFNLPNMTGGGLAAVAALIGQTYSGQASRTLIYNNYGSSGMPEEDLFAAVGRGRAWGY